jgi:hypothetical protein
MKQGKRSVKVLGLFLLASIGSLAVMAGSAQAATWRESGTAITSTKAFNAVLPAKGTFTFLAPETSIKVKCGMLTSEDGLMFTNGEARLVLKVSGCATYIKGVFAPECDPDVVKMSTIIKPVWVEFRAQLLFSPTAGGIFGYLEFEEECPLSHIMPLKGSFVEECVTPASCETSTIIHSITQNWALDELKYGSWPMYTEGILELELANGSPFSVSAP